MNPLFSIITITFNAANELPATLESVKCQTVTDYEHLIIDGASTDDTVEVAKRARIASMRIVSEPDKGLYDAMNKGMRLATGKYLIFLNAGDAFHSATSLQEIKHSIDLYGFPDVVYGQTQIVNARREFVSMRHLTAPEHLSDVRQLQARHAGVSSGVCREPSHCRALRLELSFFRRLRVVSAMLEEDGCGGLYRHHSH